MAKKQRCMKYISWRENCQYLLYIVICAANKMYRIKKKLNATPGDKQINKCIYFTNKLMSVSTLLFIIIRSKSTQINSNMI